MNISKHNRLFVALGAALFAGSMLSANPAAAQEDPFQAYASQTRAQVRAELTAQPGPAERLRDLQEALSGARVVAGLDDIPRQGRRAIAQIRADARDSFKQSAPAAVGQVLAQAQVRPVRVAKVETPEDAGREWSMPAVQLKPLLDMNILLFRFQK